MTRKEYVEEVCTKCINYCELCPRDEIIETQREDVTIPKCKNYRKWSNLIDKSFENYNRKEYGGDEEYAKRKEIR